MAPVKLVRMKREHGARLLRGPKGRRAGGVLSAGGRRLTLALATSLIVIAVLTIVGFGPALVARWRRRRQRREAELAYPAYDPGRERRAEVRARGLLRSVVSAEEYAMYA